MAKLSKQTVVRLQDASKQDVQSLLAEYDDGVNFASVEVTVPTESSVDSVVPSEPTGDTSRQDIVSLHRNADPYHILQTLHQFEGWTLSTTIRESIPADTEVNRDTVANTLWRLDHRGLVESRKNEEDNRMREYRITDLGERSLESVESQKATSTAGDTDEDVPTIRTGGDPFNLMRTLDDVKWMTAEEIRSAADNGINSDTVSSTLWRLTDRSLLESRPLEEDNRYKEYRLTEKGASALDEAVARDEGIRGGA